jgi:integrase
LPVETLTDARVRSAAPPKTGILELWDGKTSGLCFRVMKSGVRSWTFRYRPHSGAAFRRVTLGRYPALSLVEARAAAERLRDKVRTGADPQQQTRDDREALRAAPDLTFDALADLYVERYAKRQKASWKNDEGYLRANARPVWGKREATSITSQDAARLLFDVVAVAPISANRLRSVLVKLFGWACDSALLSTNPMLGVKKPHREGKGKTRTLNDKEIKVLWHALEKAEAAPGILAALKFLLLLGQRPGEVAGMAVSELHHLNNDRNAHWQLPASRMKARRAHVVPLPPLAREIVVAEIAGQRATTPLTEPEFVFASKFAERARLARHSLSQALGRIIEDLDESGDDADTVANLKADRPTPHDLRRTLATGLARLGIPRDDRLAVLAHSYGDIHEIYDQYERLPQKRAALEMWERHVRKVIADQPQADGKVLPLWK